MKWLRLFSAFALSILLAPALSADTMETSRETDTHIFYFNVLNSSFLAPEIAQQYNIARSNYRAVLNLAVHEKTADGSKAIPALLEGTVTNIVQQQAKLDFQEIREGQALYYLSDFRISDDDLLTFKVTIRTHADAPGYELEFKRRVYTNH